jgi:hypothetical protein
VIIRNFLESVLFKENDLAAIKEATTNLAQGIITTKQFKELILNSRLTILDELAKVVELYAQNLKTKENENLNANEILTLTQENQRLRDELQEHKQLLSDIIPRIERLEQISSASNRDTLLDSFET